MISRDTPRVGRNHRASWARSIAACDGLRLSNTQRGAYWAVPLWTNSWTLLEARASLNSDWCAQAARSGSQSCATYPVCPNGRRFAERKRCQSVRGTGLPDKVDVFFGSVTGQQFDGVDDECRAALESWLGVSRLGSSGSNSQSLSGGAFVLGAPRLAVSGLIYPKNWSLTPRSASGVFASSTVCTMAPRSRSLLHGQAK